MKKIFSMIVPLALSGAIALPQAATAGDTLDRVISTEQITFGYRTDAPPFAYYKDGRARGYSVELCSLIMGAVFLVSDVDGITGNFVAVSAEERFNKLRAGEIDVLCGATTATLERRETMSFTIPTFSTGAAAALNDGATKGIRNLFSGNGPRRFTAEKRSQEVDGAKIGVRNGTTTAAWVEATFKAANDRYSLSAYADHALGLAALRNGEIDAYVADQAILRELMKRAGNPGDVSISPRTFTHEPYALAIARGDEDMRLMLDRALSYLFRTGQILKIYKKYFGDPSDEVERFFLTTELPE